MCSAALNQIKIERSIMTKETATHVIVKTDVLDLTFTRTDIGTCLLDDQDPVWIDNCLLDLSASTYPFYLSIMRESHFKDGIFELAVQNPLTGNLMFNHPLAVHLQGITNSPDDEVVFRMSLETLNKVLKLVQLEVNQLHIMHVQEPLFKSIKRNLLTKADVETIARVDEVDGPRLRTDKYEEEHNND